MKNSLNPQPWSLQDQWFDPSLRSSMIKYNKEEIEVTATFTWKVTLQYLVKEVQSLELWDIDGIEIINEEECEDNEEIEL